MTINSSSVISLSYFLSFFCKSSLNCLRDCQDRQNNALIIVLLTYFMLYTTCRWWIEESCSTLAHTAVICGTYSMQSLLSVLCSPSPSCKLNAQFYTVFQKTYTNIFLLCVGQIRIDLNKKMVRMFWTKHSTKLCKIVNFT